MTLPPERLVDKGQRYEIWCDSVGGRPWLIGWSDAPDAFEDVVALNPVLTNHRAVDRWGEIK